MRKMKTITMYEAARVDKNELYNLYDTPQNGLDDAEAKKRLEQFGKNTTRIDKKEPFWLKVLKVFSSPFTLVLLGLGVISFMTEYVFADVGDKDATSAIIIFLLVLASGTMTLIQNDRSDKAAKKLQSIVEISAAVKRDGTFSEIPTSTIVPGDLVALRAGDMIPADMRLISSKDLFISQTSLTGESYPVEKKADAVVKEGDAPVSFGNICYTGSEVVSGSAIGIVVSTGLNTMFGDIVRQLASAPIKTSFDIGIEKTSKLLVRFMMVMAPLVIIINGLTKGNWLDALLFGISIAVGLTPEMLPMIVTTNLVKGANDLAKRKTIVRSLNSMQNFGAIDVLCTDKTGTLTQNQIVLEYHLGINGESSNRVLKHAYLNSYFQTGLKNLMDKAIIKAADEEISGLGTGYEKIDEIPFDFVRRRMSVVVADKNGKTQLITKGALEEMLSISSFVDIDGKVRPLTDKDRNKIVEDVDKLNQKGFRVLGVAQKTNPPDVDAFSIEDEHDMVMIGYLAFLDPPKETTHAAIMALKRHHVDVKVLTGDSELVTRHVCKEVGMDIGEIVFGEDLIGITEKELAKIAEEHVAFVKLTPTQKADIVRVLRQNGHVVGFMGDGINDSPAMRQADVSISVDNAVDIAKDSADIILLEKDLLVLEQGLVKGREVFGNIMKYIKATTSSNFGNIFSVLLASIFLPFLPMTPVQLLFLNLVYDLSCMAIPWDHMDMEYLEKPKKWEAASIRNFMIWFGPTSSVFDQTTFLFMYWLIIPVSMGLNYVQLTSGTDITTFESVFHTGWFIMSLWTQTLVLYALRTPKFPFIESRPAFSMMTITLLGMLVGTVIPFTVVGKFLNLLPVPDNFWILLIVNVAFYLGLVTLIKKIYVKKYTRLL